MTTRTSSPRSSGGEIPNDTVMETEHTLAFNDIRPQAPVHVLVIPKGPYVTFDHFAADASEAEIADFHRVAARIVAEAGIGPGEGGAGYRTLSNAGEDAVQGSAALSHAHSRRSPAGPDAAACLTVNGTAQPAAARLLSRLMARIGGSAPGLPASPGGFLPGWKGSDERDGTLAGPPAICHIGA